MWTEVRISEIELGDRLRPVDPDAVARLADSIKEEGLINPITITPHLAYEQYQEVMRPLLVAGLHRIEAFKLLGRDTIPCRTMAFDEVDRQIAEIDENLMRAELGDAMRAKFMAKRKELYLEKHPETARGLAGANAKHGHATDNLSFADDTAAKTGVSDRDVRRAVRRGKRIDGAVLDSIAGTDMDKGVELDALASMKDGKQQKKAVEMVKSGKVASLRDAKIKLQPDKNPSDRSKIDSDVKARAAKEVAGILAEHVPGEWWDALKANLYAAKANNIADEFTNITGQSIMDCRFA